MERMSNTLHFKPEEEGKFLRAISLVGRALGYSSEVYKSIIKDEKAHIDKAKELGIQDKIRGYEIEARREFRLSVGKFTFLLKRRNLVAKINMDTDISDSECIQTSMAPENPSAEDFYYAMTRLGFEEDELVIAKRYAKCKDGVTRYREYLLHHYHTDPESDI